MRLPRAIVSADLGPICINHPSLTVSICGPGGGGAGRGRAADQVGALALVCWLHTVWAPLPQHGNSKYVDKVPKLHISSLTSLN